MNNLKVKSPKFACIAIFLALQFCSVPSQSDFENNNNNNEGTGQSSTEDLEPESSVQVNTNGNNGLNNSEPTPSPEQIEEWVKFLGQNFHHWNNQTNGVNGVNGYVNGHVNGYVNGYNQTNGNTSLAAAFGHSGHINPHLNPDFLGGFWSASERTEEDFTLEFHRLKSRLILRTMDAITPSVLFMQSSLCDLLASPKPTSLSEYNEANEKAEKSFAYVENWLEKTRAELDTCGQLHDETAGNLQKYRSDINNFLAPANGHEQKSSGNGKSAGSKRGGFGNGRERSKDMHREPSSGGRCGGKIEVTQKPYLNFTSFISIGNQSEETFCLWVLTNARGRVEGVSYSISPTAVDLKGGTLTLHRNFQGHESPAVDSMQVGFSVDFIETAVLIFSKSAPLHKTSSLCEARRRSGRRSISTFSLYFQPQGQSSRNAKKEQQQQSNGDSSPNSGKMAAATTMNTDRPEGYHAFGWPRPMSPFLSFFSYPAERDAYWPNERTFFVFFPAAKSLVELSLRRLNTESHQDFLSFFKYSQDTETFQFLDKKSGRLNPDGNNLYEGNPNEPVLLYFHSDASRSYAGFQISYGSREL